MADAVLVLLLVCCQILLYAQFVLFDPHLFDSHTVVALGDPKVRTQIAVDIVSRAEQETPALVPFHDELLNAAERVADSDPFEEALNSALVESKNNIVSNNQAEQGFQLRVVGTTGMLREQLMTGNPALAASLPDHGEVMIGGTDKAGRVSFLAEIVGRFWKFGVVFTAVLLFLMAWWVAHADRWLAALRRMSRVLVFAGALTPLLVSKFFTDGFEWFGLRVLDSSPAQAIAPLIEPLSKISVIFAVAGLSVWFALFGAAVPSDLEEPLMPTVRRWLAARLGGHHSTPARALQLAVALLIAGFLFAWPSSAPRWLSVGAGVAITAAVLRRLIAWNTRRAAPDKVDLGFAGIRPLALILPLSILSLGIVVAFATRPGTSVSDGRVLTGHRCNGSRELCSRPLAQVYFAGTHNSMNTEAAAAKPEHWSLPQQYLTIPEQLDAGIRVLLVDMYPGQSHTEGVFTKPHSRENGIEKVFRERGNELGFDLNAMVKKARRRILNSPEAWSSGLFMCHGFCELGAIPAEVALGQVGKWLADNPREAVMIVIEDYVKPSQIAKAFAEAGELEKLAYSGGINSKHPQLGTLIEKDKRLLVFAENISQPDPNYPWLRPAYISIRESRTGGPSRQSRRSAFVDTPYDIKDADRLGADCSVKRGDKRNPLFMLNNFVSEIPANGRTAERVNSRRFLDSRIKRCLDSADAGNRRPNIIAVDNFRINDGLITLVKDLNGEKRPVVSPTDAVTTSDPPLPTTNLPGPAQ